MKEKNTMTTLIKFTQIMIDRLHYNYSIYL